MIKKTFLTITGLIRDLYSQKCGLSGVSAPLNDRCNETAGH